MSRIRVVLVVLLGFLVLLLPACEDDPPPAPKIEKEEPAAAADEQRLGTITLSASCNDAANNQVTRALALLHHMTYQDARAGFAAATEADPDCAIAYWGQAMTWIHPLWSDPPSAEEYQQGQALLAKAQQRGEPSEKEQAFIDATAAYYEGEQQAGEKLHLKAFAQAWEEVYEAYPDDAEAASFYALALLGTASADDKTYRIQKRAGAIAEAVLEQTPSHPGAHHYVIHAYDYPPLARKAEGVARSYGELAPAVPHALHMPSHILTRLGQWEDVIVYNERSATAALDHSVHGKVSLHYPHALDYLAYAHLQRGEDQQAQNVAEQLSNVADAAMPHLASAYAFAAIPARLALETRDWEAAAALPVREPESYPWGEVPEVEAITHFARALGAVHTGDTEAANAEVDRLVELRDSIASDYWSQQVEIQRRSAEAWLLYANDEYDDALALMKVAAEMEAGTDKHPVTPGEVLPAHELLGDMLFERERYQQALKAYQRSLERSPNRFHSLAGAARAARQLDQPTLAGDYYSKLLAVTAPDSARETLEEARQYLAKVNGDSKMS